MTLSVVLAYPALRFLNFSLSLHRRTWSPWSVAVEVYSVFKRSFSSWKVLLARTVSRLPASLWTFTSVGLRTVYYTMCGGSFLCLLYRNGKQSQLPLLLRGFLLINNTKIEIKDLCKLFLEPIGFFILAIRVELGVTWSPRRCHCCRRISVSTALTIGS